MKPSLIALLATLPLLTFATELDFEEKFADPATRDAALAELVPGTRDWFFHHALHHQLRGKTDAFQRVADDWQAATSRRRDPVSSDGLETLRTLTDGTPPPTGRLALFISHPEKGSRTLTLE